MIQNIRNIAIVAHVDHGKTTLVDRLLQQSDTLSPHQVLPERALDSNELEKERGITILAKNTAIRWKEYRINVVDTPGHADFGGEVERILSMVDSVLLLVDAVDGPMPQTRFVTQKAFARGLNPIVVVNKIDRLAARPEWVVNQVFELFDRLGANNQQLDFPIVYASALQGIATLDLKIPGTSMVPLFETIIQKVSCPLVSLDGPFQMQVSALDYSSYVGTIGIGRVHRGRITPNTPIVILDREGVARKGRVLQVLGFIGLNRFPIEQAEAGDIIAVTGVDDLKISETLCDPDNPNPLPLLTVDEPTVTAIFQVNDSPFAGKEGKFVTSRKLRERLQTELLHNVALKVEDTVSPDKWKVSGRGELHLAILIETMRREGYELAVTSPQVIVKEVGGVLSEPYEQLTVDIESRHQGVLMEALGAKRAELQNMTSDGVSRVRLDYIIPARTLIGFQTEFMTLTSGTGLLYHVFEKYGPLIPDEAGSQRRQGAMVSNGTGFAIAAALFNLQERGRLCVVPGEAIYEGMIVGIHSRDNDLVVNPLRTKKLTNIRSAGNDENIILTPALKPSLEQAMGLINEDELIEITPKSLRLRKKFLTENDRKREGRLARGSF
ncbi:MAG: translational GTPase TypA [Gammaproteobacteria bacterium]|nr:translational GTPase TypA [Gammaproteobacteria bacterium]